MNEAGQIHGRAIKQDPASAQELLNGYARQVGWAAELLNADIGALEEQESSNAVGIDLADAGGAVDSVSPSLPQQPSNQNVPLTFVPPVVMPGTSLLQLANNFNATRFNELGQAASDWSTMGRNISQVVEQLNSAASQIESENDSDFTRSAASKIRELASIGEQFAANATLMNQRAFGLLSKAPMGYVEIPADLQAVSLVPDPVLKKSMEAALLVKWQAKLQEMVTSSLPNQQSLAEAPAASGGGDNLNVGLGSIAGTGTRYNTDEVAWPQEIQDAIASGEIGPGSFGVADGELVALENIDQGLVDQVREAVNQRNEALYGGGRLQEFINGGMTSLADTNTQTAGIGMPSGTAVNGGVNPSLGYAGAANNGTGFGGGANGMAASGLGPLGVLGSRGGFAGAGTGAGAGAGAGSVGAGIRNGVPGAGLGGLRGGGAIAGGRGIGISGGDGGARLLGGGDSPARAGSAVGGSSGTNGAGAAAHGTGSQGQHGRGIGPMMAPAAAAGRNQDKKKSSEMIKAVTSRVEANKNRRDLLGEPPAALPGPIGDWARQEV
ncbi:hypothetical protein [Corynebacterium stationis]|uniref:hypothetical protein n=1 Tax=Corynebacterium stationis TaxID=1705 RepID=UPI001E0FAD40|nr:hypothetical protein [Corynebacterium stationis]HJG65002.1 hypothetical protein [Corynebacterium stationis]